MFKVMQDFGHQPYERLVIRSGDVWSFWSPWVHYNMAQETPFEVFAPFVRPKKFNRSVDNKTNKTPSITRNIACTRALLQVLQKGLIKRKRYEGLLLRFKLREV